MGFIELNLTAVNIDFPSIFHVLLVSLTVNQEVI